MKKVTKSKKQLDTVRELEAYLGQIKNKDLPLYALVTYCEETTDVIDNQEKVVLDRAKGHRFVIVGAVVTNDDDILDSNHGEGLELHIHQNESLRVHGPWAKPRPINP